ncbi:MAG: PstS family phosphate ABC transporter substrate-binding protein [Breznakibacter sp.]
MDLKSSMWAASLIVLAACGGNQNKGAKGDLTGQIRIDGSSTVYPITEAIAEEFRAVSPNVKVTVGISGTGGGFKKFGRGETDINDASRPIKEKEAEACKENQIEYQQLTVAYDGMAIVVNPQNDWANDITVAELKKLWEPQAEGAIMKWSDIRPEWPGEKINLYGADAASGTYDYFTEVIVGESGKSRGDYTNSSDDNVLVQGISTDKYALGYFGLAYYEENMDKLKLLGVDAGNGVVLPSFESVSNHTYTPLSRPIYIYVSKSAADRSEVKAFVEFYLDKAASISKDVGYVALPAERYTEEQAKFAQFIKQ